MRVLLRVHMSGRSGAAEPFAVLQYIGGHRAIRLYEQVAMVCIGSKEYRGKDGGYF